MTGASDRFVWLATILLLLCGSNVRAVEPAAPAGPPQHRVLVLYSDHRLLPANIIRDEAIRETFAISTSSHIEFHSEFLDPGRFPGDAQELRERDYLRDKYRDRPPALVIATGEPPLTFLVKYRADLFTNVPVVYSSVAGDRPLESFSKEWIAGIPVSGGVTRTLETALRLHPPARRVVVVFGTGDRDRQLAESVREELLSFAGRATITPLTGLTMEELRGALARLPDDAVVLYLTMFEDAAGRRFIPRQALDEFASASRVPIYAIFDTYVGHGIVGGMIVTFQEIARKSAQLGLRILAGEDPHTAARSLTYHPVGIFDSRQLRRWNISEDTLPPGSEVRFKELTYWEKHRRIILIAASLCALEAVLIVALLRQRRRSRRAEASLRESEESVSLAADSAGAGLWATDMSGDGLWLTNRTRHLFEFAPDQEVTWEDIRLMIHPEDRAEVEQVVRDSIVEGKPFVAEFRVVHGDGRQRWMVTRGRPHPGSNGKLHRLMGATVDITERKNSEDEARRHFEELVHMSRVNLVGELSGSLVHEIGQPLGAILANSEVAQLHCGNPQPDFTEMREILADIRQDSLRAGEVLHGMRNLLRRQEMKFETVNLHSLFADVEKLGSQDVALRSAKLEFRTGEELPLVRGHRVQLQQVLLNLILNARQAMEDCPVDERKLLVTASVIAGKDVEIAVEDRGRGIPPDRLEEVFTPFLTTKATGLGIGLSICRRIIEAHGGRIGIENNSTRGATVRFTLPALPTSDEEALTRSLLPTSSAVS